MKTTKAIIRFYALSILLFTNVYAQEMTKEINLGCETSLLTAPVWVAQDKGYFQEEGLNVKTIEFDSGKASFGAMLNQRNIDISTVAQTPIMLRSFNRNDFVIIAAIVHSDNDVKVLVRQDKGIKNPSDLRGKKVGITKGSTGQFFLDLFLIYNGVISSKIETIDLKPPELPQAIADGRVDAICTWEPHILKAKKLLGAEALILPSQGIYREDFYFVANKNFVKNNPEILKTFLKSIAKGQKFIQENKEKSISIVSHRLKLDKNLTAMIWDEFRFQLMLDQTILLSLEDEARWAMREGLTDKKEIPNYLDFIYMHALEQVKPEAVTIIR
jgi:ABC-type nitrate/sulfonate/bicarbonate transport system substrate-binding protein